MNPIKATHAAAFSSLESNQKRIPIAIFAVIAVHVLLFLLLLLAAGFRAASRQSQAPVDEAARAVADYAPDEPLDAEVAERLPKLEATVAPAPVLATEPDDEPPASLADLAKPVPVTAVVRNNGAAKTYVVKAGDTLSEIARNHRTTVQLLRSRNNLKADRLRIGQTLRVEPENPKRSRQA